jgi:hypothetical protein
VAVPSHPDALVVPALLADTARNVRGVGPMREVLPARSYQAASSAVDYCAPVLVPLNLVGRKDIDCWPTARDGTGPARLTFEMTP